MEEQGKHKLYQVWSKGKASNVRPTGLAKREKSRRGFMWSVLATKIINIHEKFLKEIILSCLEEPFCQIMKNQKNSYVSNNRFFVFFS